MGFANSYASYVRNFAKLAAPLMEKLKVGRVLGKNGFKHPLHLSESDLEAFNKLKAALVSGLSPQAVNPDAPLLLRVAASKRQDAPFWNNSQMPKDQLPPRIH